MGAGRMRAAVCVHLKFPETNHCFSTSSSISNRAGIFPQGPLTGHVILISQPWWMGKEIRITFLRPISYKILSHILGFSFFFLWELFPFDSVGLSPLLKNNVLSGPSQN